MSSGKAHATISGLAVPLGGVLVSGWTMEIPSGVCFAAGCLFGIILSPDLDHEKRTISEAIMYKIPVIGFLFQVFFYPYALMIRHRSPLSHLPILGTVIRLAYTLLPLLLVALRFYPVELQRILSFQHIEWHTIWLFVGLLTSDFLHWVADGFPV